MDIEAIPFNRLIGITHAKQEGGVLALPDEVRYTNHLGTVHAGAQLALAEASSGEFLWREFKEISFDVLPVVRRLEAKFRKPAFGAVFSTVSIDPGKKAEFVAALTSKGRALIEVQVDVYDEKGTHALAA
jgi:Domain of unknown function (DUF4442)